MNCYHHLTIEERETLYRGLCQGKSLRGLGRELGRSPSTLSRELRRNGGEYHPWRAQGNYHKRREGSVRRYVLEQPQLRHTVHFLLGWLYWSPEQISNRLRLEGRFTIGTSTIYRALERGQLRNSLRFYLRRKYKTFGKSSKKTRECFSNSIDQRPLQALHRSELGHFEGDTISGHGSRACILSLVDRRSRLLIAGKADSKEAKNINALLPRLLHGHPLRSLTFDQGTEFSQAAALADALGAGVYFAHPHAPWERPSNENTNGLLRQFFPKEKSLASVSQEELDRVVALLNFRPRKSLNWRAPYEAHFHTLLHFT